MIFGDEEKGKKVLEFNPCRSVKVLDPCLYFGAAKMSTQR